MNDGGDMILNGPEDLAHLFYQMDDHGVDPARPFVGQPHTDQGERGKTMVQGLCFRDVADCFVLGWLMATGRSSLAESGTATYNDVYQPGINCDGSVGYGVDPLAVMKNMTCEMERRMGIFPNVPELRPTGPSPLTEEVEDTGEEGDK